MSNERPAFNPLRFGLVGMAALAAMLKPKEPSRKWIKRWIKAGRPLGRFVGYTPKNARRDWMDTEIAARRKHNANRRRHDQMTCAPHKIRREINHGKPMLTD